VGSPRAFKSAESCQRAGTCSASRCRAASANLLLVVPRRRGRRFSTAGPLSQLRRWLVTSRAC